MADDLFRGKCCQLFLLVLHGFLNPFTSEDNNQEKQRDQDKRQHISRKPRSVPRLIFTILWKIDLMEVELLKMFLIAHVSAEFGKHVYVPDSLSWTEAQNVCRENYTDLSPITTPWEEEELKTATRKKVGGHVWIGLYFDQSQWLWSGGAAAKNIPWSAGQPDGSGIPATVVCWRDCDTWPGWHDVPQSFTAPFFCINLIVVEKRKPWEEALRYCRTTHTTLTSLVSKTENLLAQRGIQRGDITERVWIGMRFLGDHWMWVNGDPLLYEAWSTGVQDHQCPIQNRCGALSKAGVWEAVDCEVRLNFICY